MSQIHRASAECAAPARAAFRFLASGRLLGRWALGCFGTRRVAPGLYRGRSLFDGEALLVRPVADPAHLTVHYFVGARRTALAARAFARAEARGARRCRVWLVVQRPPEMSLERWRRLKACHEVEVLLICALLKSARKGKRGSR
jgi:hypothetical protein